MVDSSKWQRISRRVPVNCRHSPSMRPALKGWNSMSKVSVQMKDPRASMFSEFCYRNVGTSASFEKGNRLCIKSLTQLLFIARYSLKTPACLKPYSSFRASFDAPNGKWTTIRIPFLNFEAKGAGIEGLALDTRFIALANQPFSSTF